MHKNKYILELAKINCLPSGFYTSEILMELFNISDEVLFYEIFNYLSKNKCLKKENKKFSPLEPEVYDKFKYDNIENELNKYNFFLAEILDPDYKKPFKLRNLLAELAYNFVFKYKDILNDKIIITAHFLTRHLLITGKYEKAYKINRLIKQSLILKYNSDKDLFIAAISNTDQLKYQAKFKEALQTIENAHQYIASCTNPKYIVKYYLLYFSVLRTNALQKKAMDLYNEAKITLNTLNADEYYLNRLNMGLASIYLDLDLANKAIELVPDLIEIQEKYTHKLHPYIAECNMIIGSANNFIGNFELCKEHNLLALEILEFNYSSPSQEKASIYYQLAAAFLAEQNYGLARENIQKAIKTAKECMPKNHPDHYFYQSLDIIVSRWNYPEAIKDMTLLFDKIKNYFPKNHPIIGFFHNNLAMLYSEKKDFEKSNFHLMEAYQINYNLYEKETVNQAFMLSNIALNYEFIERYEDAISLLDRAEKILVNQLGERHQDLAKIYEAHASVYSQTSKIDKAISYRLKSIKIIKYYTPEHPSLIPIMINIAHNYLVKNKLKEAKKYVEQALALNDAFFENKNYTQVKIYNIYFKISQLNPNEKSDIELAQKAGNTLLELWSEFLVDDEFLTLSNETFQTLVDANLYNEANNLAQKIESALNVTEVLHMKISPKVTASTIKTLAQHSLNHGEYFKSIQLSKKILQILKQNNLDIPEIMELYYPTIIESFLGSKFHKLQSINYIEDYIELEKNKTELSNPSKLLELYRILGNLYLAKNEKDKAIKVFSNALAIYSKSEEKNEMLSFVFTDIASLYLKEGNMQKAIEYQEKALNNFHFFQAKNPEQEDFFLLHLIRTYFLASKYKEAFKAAHKMADKYSNSNNTLVFNRIYLMLQNFYEDIGHKDKASEYLKKLFKSMEKAQIRTIIFDFRNKIIKMKNLANNRRFSEARELGLKLLEETKKENFLSLFEEVLNFLIELDTIDNLR